MNKIPKRLRKLLDEHRRRAWEAEMRRALGALAGHFDRWRDGTLDTGDLDAAIHEYHQGIARDIWKRHNAGDPALPLAYAVATGAIARESLPAEVLERIAPLLGLWSDESRSDG